MRKKDMYVSPQVEVIEMENEGAVMSASTPTVGNGGSAYSSARSTGHYNSASNNELEDMINDILTIEQ